MSIVASLEARAARVIAAVEQHAAYHLIFSPASSRAAVIEVVRSILLRIHYYGPYLAEAAFTAIGRFPRTRPQLFRPLVDQLIDEIYHPEIALKDFLRMGGSEDEVRRGRMTPASFVVAATAKMLAEHEEPFAYLGFVALLEFTTPVLTERVMPVLSAHRAVDSTKFVPLHAKEDHEHAALIKRQIEIIVKEYPQAGAAIEYGFDCFSQVYPLPIWDEALCEVKAAE